MLPPNIKSYKDLITPRSEIKKGFLEQALTKTHKAVPYVEKAIALRRALEAIGTIRELVNESGLLPELEAAAGFSAKAASHLSIDERKSALMEVLNRLANESVEGWKDELLYRYLLTKGDSLGGEMRNYVGAVSQNQFSTAIEIALRNNNITPQIERSRKGKVQAVQWQNRVLFFDRKPSWFTNNIDCLLVETTGSPSIHKPRELLKLEYVRAAGELKGGIDPAGADEHWKTGRSGIGRIRNAVSKAPRTVELFLIARAIEKVMATEIFGELKDDQLSYAANLTSPKQVTDLANWLISL